MTHPITPRPNATRENTKSKLDWLDAAYEAVIEGGINEARILPLSKRLGVTRGSFYWHFSDQPALIAELVERWHSFERATMERLSAIASDDPRADLHAILHAAMGQMGPNNVRFELALRELGRRDTAVAHMLVQVDAERTQLFARQFARINPETAQDKAVLLYLAMVGAFNALWRPHTSATFQNYLMRVIARLAIDGATDA